MQYENYRLTNYKKHYIFIIELEKKRIVRKKGNKNMYIINKINKLNKKIHKNIKIKIKENGITQAEIAQKIGVSPATLCDQLKKLSEGKSILTETLFKIAYALEIEVTELLK